MGNKTRRRPLPPDPSQCANQTPFRLMERTFKRKTTTPSELASLLHNLEENNTVDEDSSTIQFHSLTLSPALSLDDTHSQSHASSSSLVYATAAIPGLFVIKRAIPPLLQRQLVRECLATHSRLPNLSNLDAHYNVPAEGLWSMYCRSRSTGHEEHLHPRCVAPEPEPSSHNPNATSTPTAIGSDATQAMMIDAPTDPMADPKPAGIFHTMHRLRWVTLGYHYDWTCKQYHLDRRHVFPESIADLTRRILTHLEPLTGYPSQEWRAEAGIINWYHPGDSLMSHQDRSEIDSVAPLVSVSVGLSAVFLVAPGATRDATPVALQLDSGDVVVLSGSARRVFHGVPLVMANTCPSYLLDGDEDEEWSSYSKWMDHSRLNINVRQVFPFTE
ncbi:hypothetical protein BASA50_004316 [Batrachochytrium salamandrivorans]|uniref:Fe2OG dioxygenase domain-containing protein n=1 Tax=Batrachochytrium salamandrivorans TaxID=1357716 RepID=A0ABQ8FIW7_9FUNG|nr:hypothetical protein BASA61_009729 [Batrachochytrium salamandrivorans]KAH6597711.1 hypothetical protein BASA50_004316 [Batrachochytrium salamandrivorans]KAH9264519.1 alkylated DNA repair protein AlkB [Batrachochytrium salamandrivorans]